MPFLTPEEYVQRRTRHRHDRTRHKSKGGVILRKWWDDQEPERLTVDLRRDPSNLNLYVSFTTSCTFLDLTQVQQLIEYLEQCEQLMKEDND